MKIEESHFGAALSPLTTTDGMHRMKRLFRIGIALAGATRLQQDSGVEGRSAAQHGRDDLYACPEIKTISIGDGAQPDCKSYGDYR